MPVTQIAPQICLERESDKNLVSTLAPCLCLSSAYKISHASPEEGKLSETDHTYQLRSAEIHRSREIKDVEYWYFLKYFLVWLNAKKRKRKKKMSWDLACNFLQIHKLLYKSTSKTSNWTGVFSKILKFLKFLQKCTDLGYSLSNFRWNKGVLKSIASIFTENFCYCT